MKKVVSFGGGVNGVAMLIAMVKAQDKPDAILFADTGGEVQETYDYIEYFSHWLESVGFPQITTVTYKTKKGLRVSLLDEIIKAKTLPSIAFGFKTCSQKHKIFPQQKWVKYHYGKESITWYVGFDAAESRRMKPNPTEGHQNKYLLIELGWDRARCIEEILKASMEVPCKSSCFFCPNRKKPEILLLPPHLKKMVMHIEANAMPNMIKVKGLGRRFSWTDLIEGRTKEADKETEMQTAFKNKTGEDLEPIVCECID